MSPQKLKKKYRDNLIRLLITSSHSMTGSVTHAVGSRKAALPLGNTTDGNDLFAPNPSGSVLWRQRVTPSCVLGKPPYKKLKDTIWTLSAAHLALLHLRTQWGVLYCKICHIDTKGTCCSSVHPLKLRNSIEPPPLDSVCDL